MLVFLHVNLPLFLSSPIRPFTIDKLFPLQKLPYPFFIGSELLLFRGICSSSSVSTSFSINLAASYPWFSEEKKKSSSSAVRPLKSPIRDVYSVLVIYWKIIIFIFYFSKRILRRIDSIFRGYIDNTKNNILI